MRESRVRGRSHLHSHHVRSPHPSTISPRQDLSWPAAKRFMGNVDAFLKSLLTFDKENIPLPSVEQVRGGRVEGWSGEKK